MNCIYLSILLFSLNAIKLDQEASFSEINMPDALTCQDTLTRKISNPANNIASNEVSNGEVNHSAIWQLDLIGLEGPSEAGTAGFQFEVLVNQHFQGLVSGNTNDINVELNNYREKLSDTDVLLLILLNKEYQKMKIHSGEGSYFTNDQEIYFYFHPGYTSQYTVQISEESHESEDYFFFYIEKSNGIENLRDVRNRIEPLIEEKKSFLAYFHGPGNRALILSHEDDSHQIDEFFNILFTSRTQPPLVPNDELRNVYEIISQFVSEYPSRINLELYLYFNEASYSFLLEPFIKPLLETRMPKLNLMDWHAYIMSDFNIQSINDQYTYINLVNP